MKTERKSSETDLKSDSVSEKCRELRFSRPQPTGLIPLELQSNRYRATELQSHEATEQIPSGGCGCDVTLLMPSSADKHVSAWEGPDNCLWRLCRTIRATCNHSSDQATGEADSVFDLWYASYQAWCENVGVIASPKSRLHDEFLAALEKCKLREDETLVAYAFKRAKELPFPAETVSFADDKDMCLLANTLRECAIFNDAGGLCYASTRDIEKHTGLCNKDTAGRWLRQLERRKVLLRIFDGASGVMKGTAARFIYLPLMDLKKMSPKTRKLYSEALEKCSSTS